MARRRVQDEGESKPTASDYIEHETKENGSVEVHVAENTPKNREVIERAVAAISKPAPVVNVASAPETVTVTWGEELFTPVQFCSFRVGPYSAATTLRPGESREQAADRLMRELERIAAKERDIKIRVYREGLEKVIPRKGAAS